MTERKIALFDIDKTSYRDLLFLDLCRYQFQTGILPELNLSAIERNIGSYVNRQGLTYLEMAQSALVDWPNGLKGKRVDEVTSNTREFFQTDGNKFYSYVEESINLLNQTHDTYFVTAEPQFVGEEVARKYQATGYRSTMFEVIDGFFTGNVTSSLARKEDKGKALKELMLDHSKEQSFAFGDSGNDIELLEGVEYPICVNPNDELQRVAMEKGWIIKEPEEIVIYVRGALVTPRS